MYKPANLGKFSMRPAPPGRDCCPAGSAGPAGAHGSAWRVAIRAPWGLGTLPASLPRRCLRQVLLTHEKGVGNRLARTQDRMPTAVTGSIKEGSQGIRTVSHSTDTTL